MQLKDIRQKTGLTQKAFAARYHIPLQTLKQWECAPGSKSYRTPPEYILYMVGRLVEIDYAADPAAQDRSAGAAIAGGPDGSADMVNTAGSNRLMDREEYLIYAARRSR